MTPLHRRERVSTIAIPQCMDVMRKNLRGQAGFDDAR